MVGCRVNGDLSDERFFARGVRIQVDMSAIRASRSHAAANPRHGKALPFRVLSSRPNEPFQEIAVRCVIDRALGLLMGIRPAGFPGRG